MDTSLKTDLMTVRDNIKRDIWNKIVEFKVDKLDDLVKRDLGTLKKKISDLANDGGAKLAESHLKLLHEAKEKTSNLDPVVEKIQDETNVNLEKNFTSHIQNPLSTKVQAVNEAIGTLGGNFKNGDMKTFAEIFGHIKNKVAAIRGTPKKGRHNGSGLEGIVSGLQNYARVIGQNVETSTVSGWVRDIVNGNVLVGGWIEEYVTENGNNFKDRTLSKDNEKAAKVKTVIQNKIQELVKGVNPKPTGKSGIGETLKEIHTFHEAVSKMIKTDLDPKTKADEIAGKVKSDVYYAGENTNGELLQSAIRHTLAQLPVLVKNFDNELKTFAAEGNAGFSKLDDALKVTKDLDSQLGDATNPSQPDPSGPNISPAQVVDKRLGEVRNEVGRSENNFREIFIN
ncbi:Extracellular matrix-binding ebh, putative [Babesia ovata]|uniref:Extracellular matrix-binding ebh, putative n=1 Tax=Babesia ovata TaxID=189622 RepID=A0A2H6KAJ1_9APIC|nr:Extracellular matrix-binding ebh, putative [Babesia ovata]GBE60012.1 Extracellular matrix-binding ebh, putative [Babesia ovata]